MKLKLITLEALAESPNRGLKWRLSPLARYWGRSSVEMSRVGGKKPDFRPRRDDALRA
jgi:hypothetical protein